MIFSLVCIFSQHIRLRNKQKGFLVFCQKPCITSKYEFWYSISNIEFLATLLAKNCRFVWTLWIVNFYLPSGYPSHLPYMTLPLDLGINWIIILGNRLYLRHFDIKNSKERIHKIRLKFGWNSFFFSLFRFLLNQNQIFEN